MNTAKAKPTAPTAHSPVSGITVRKVVNDFVEISTDGNTSLGEMIDALIAQSLKEGGQVQALTLEITDDDWRLLQGGFNN